MDPMNQNSKKTSWFSPRLAFLALFCAVISFSGVREGTEPCVGTNVMSFNIRYANTGDGPNAWTNRKSLVSSTLLFHKADVAGLQEALRSVTGDFNATERDAAYIVLTGGKPAPLADARALVKAKPYGSSQSFNGFTSELRPGRIIDFIFVRDVGSVLRQGIISEKWDGRFASDHYPVLAEVVIQ